MCTVSEKKFSVSQETFDEVVKENINDFGMCKEEAVQDAVDQFKSQGADLSRVDTSADDERKGARAAITVHLDTLREVGARWHSSADAVSECISILSALSKLCNKGEDEGIDDKNKSCIGEAGGIGVIAELLVGGEELVGDADRSAEIGVLVAAIATLKDACRNHERNRDAFIFTIMTQVNSLIARALGNGCAEIAEAGLRLVRVVCTKTENNKGNFMRHQGSLIVTTALERFGSGDSKNAVVTKETCGVIRSVTMGDDRRKDFSGTYDNIRALIGEDVVLLLLEAARAFKEDPSTLAWVFQALKQLAANNTSVKQIVDNGGVEIVSESIVSFPSEALLCRTALSLFRNICANDDYKTKLVNEGGLRLILGCMQKHKNDKLLQEHGCAAMAAMALRSPSNGARIVEKGAITAVVEAMRLHPSVTALQRHACLCIRNVAARGPSLRQRMLDDGCESLLREAGKLRGCVDEAYAALRDLRCEVGLVTMGEGGEMQVGVTGFGEMPNFNPTTAETRDLEQRIQGSATAPAHAGYAL